MDGGQVEQRAAVLCDGAIPAAVWEASPPAARDDLVRTRSWFLCVRGALLADVFALDDALVGLTLAFLRTAEAPDAARLLVLERRVRALDGLARKTAMAAPLVRRFAPRPDALLADLERCGGLELLMRFEPCWFGPSAQVGDRAGYRLLIGHGRDVTEVDEAAVQGWAALLVSTRTAIEALRTELPRDLARA